MDKINPEMIAPCGMNCAICIANQRRETKREKHCEGCNNPIVAACSRCTIRRCTQREKCASGYCYECGKFPCKRLTELDARYRKNYRMSMIENLLYIKENGLDAFIENEKERWTCGACGRLICVHRGYCLNCRTTRK